MVAVPTPPAPLVKLQLMMLASHWPPQIKPPLETVAILVLLLVKLMSAATTFPAEFSAIADKVTTAPSFKETLVGVRAIDATTVLWLVLLPQPTRKERERTATNAART